MGWLVWKVAEPMLVRVEAFGVGFGAMVLVALALWVAFEVVVLSFEAWWLGIGLFLASFEGMLASFEGMLASFEGPWAGAVAVFGFGRFL